MPELVRIGCGAGFAGDRDDASLPIIAELARHRGPRFLIFETLAERTLALCQLEKRYDPSRGYSPALERIVPKALGPALQAGIRIVSNFGAANPRAAADRISALARTSGFPRARIAVIEGDDLTDVFSLEELRARESDGAILAGNARIAAANVYLGAEGIAQALSDDADVVVTGRIADPALALGPLVHVFGWSWSDWQRLACGTLAGHLLECGAQITGGYFADPGYKDVADLARLGFPIGEVGADGSLVITKVAGSGGAVTARTCKEQLLYEVHDPKKYLQPDVVADFSAVAVEEIAADRVRISGGRGAERTPTLKVSVGYVDSFIGEGQISYAGPGALARGRLALDIVRERLKLTGVATSELRFDLIGVDALHGAQVSAHANEPYEVRVRVSGRTENLREAVRIGNEVETLYTNGPAGGGGAWKSARDVVAVASVLLPRQLAKPQIRFVGA